MQVGMGFFGSKALLSAVELGLFTELARQPLSGAEIAAALALHPRAIPDFPDALVALGFLERDGDGPTARYANTPESAAFLDRAKPAYMGGILEMANARLYPFWADLTEGLKTGAPQSESKHVGASVFETLYAVPDRLEQFMAAMAGVSAGNFQALAEGFDFSRYRTLCDIGGATAQLSRFVAAKHQCRSAASDTDRQPQDRRGRARRSRDGAGRRFLRRSISKGRCHHHGHDPA
jgi:hypothetical protein